VKPSSSKEASQQPFGRWRGAVERARESLAPGSARRPAAGMPPAIVLGGYVAGLGVIRALAAMGIPTVVVWSVEQEVARVSADAGIRVEAPDPDHAEEDYVEVLLELAERTGGGLVVPTTDATVGVVARHKEPLERHYDVACVDWEIAQCFLDKGPTYELARRLGIGIPRTLEFDSPDEIEAARTEFVYPCVIKPRHSHRYFQRFGSKMALAQTYDQLIDAWTKANELGLEVLVQEFVPGDDTHGVNYNAYYWDGRPVAECTAQKLRLSPPRIGFPRAVVSREIPEVIEPGRRLLQGMGFYGFANVEFKKDARDGTYKLMEVNGRYNNSGLLSVRAGVNFPWIMYRHLVEGELPPSGLAQENGIYWIAVPSDPVRGIRQLSHRRALQRHYLRPYLRPHVFDILDRRDLRPFLAKLAGAFRARLPGARRAGRQNDLV
jgi:D-aspartate ligase